MSCASARRMEGTMLNYPPLCSLHSPDRRPDLMLRDPQHIDTTYVRA